MKTCAAVIQSLRQREPEAFALKTIHWQLFCVLTFRSAVPFESSRKKLLVSWLREFEKQLPGVDYRRILIVSRFELGKRGRRGHLHLCIAGLPQDLILGGLLPRSAARRWRQLGGGIACVRVYDSSRDGLEYVLKRPVAVHTHTLIDRPDRPVRFDELVPTLSDSVLKTMRRSRHVRDGASRT